MTNSGARSGLRSGLKYDLSFELVGGLVSQPLDMVDIDSGETRIISPEGLEWLNGVPVQFILRNNVAMDRQPVFSNRANGITHPEDLTYDHMRSRILTGQLVSHPVTRDGILELLYDREPRIVCVSFLHTLGGKSIGQDIK
jgi:hypothetical protein